MTVNSVGRSLGRKDMYQSYKDIEYGTTGGRVADNWGWDPLGYFLTGSWHLQLELAWILKGGMSEDCLSPVWEMGQSVL